MSYIDLEKEFDQAVIFLASEVAEQDKLPVASLLHSIRVGLYLQRQGASKDVILAGLLHDVAEDTNAGIEEVGAKFGSRVAELVAAMTFDEEIEAKEHSRDSIDRCKRLGRDALVIKGADLVDNLRFYLAEANSEKLPELTESLQYFLDASADELAEEASWIEIKGQREVVLATIAEGNIAR